MGGNKIMNKKILVVLLITMVFLIGIPQVQANKNVFNNFTKLYNVSNVSKLNKCETCMVSKTPPGTWNTYGSDLKKNSLIKSNPMQAMKNIELLDSDGDTFINIDEIHNSTLPGDASDYPKISVTPVQPSPTVTITQKQTPAVTVTQMQTPAVTEPKPSSTIMNGFATIIMFAVVYVLAVRKKRK